MKILRRNNKKGGKAIKWVCGIAFAVVVLVALQRLVMPKYMTESVEGNMIAEYYSENMDHDVIFIGDLRGV